jgi:hypothetical protein
MYLESLVIEDRIKKNDIKFIDQQISIKQQEIKELKERKKVKPAQEDKIKECIATWKQNYENKTFLNEFHLENSIKKHVMPNLVKLGYTGSAHDVAKIFQED